MGADLEASLAVDCLECLVHSSDCPACDSGSSQGTAILPWQTMGAPFSLAEATAVTCAESGLRGGG